MANSHELLTVLSCAARTLSSFILGVHNRSNADLLHVFYRLDHAAGGAGGARDLRLLRRRSVVRIFCPLARRRQLHDLPFCL